MAELKDPKDFPKALALLQSIDMTLYIVAAVVIEDCHCWSHQRPRCSQISLRPHLCWHWPDAQKRLGVCGFLGWYCIWSLGHRLGHRWSDPSLQQPSQLNCECWLCTIFWIDISNLCLNQQTALFGSWFTFGFTGMFWLHMNKGLWFSSPKKIMLTLLNTFAIGVGITLVSISYSLMDSYKHLAN